jgi:hypothetical protein
MGQPEQFAKDTFAEEVEPNTHGALAWADPPESRLSKVQPDGMLRVLAPERVPELEAPWSAAAGFDEILLEVKMAGDHLDRVAVARALLRRQVREVERLEDEKAPWDGIEPVWVSAPHVPRDLRERCEVKPFAPGCYLVGPAMFPFVWIASNELPLRGDLVPFLLTRSGKALDEFAFWIAERRPAPWLLNMIKSVAMSQLARKWISRLTVPSDDPEVLQREREMYEAIFEARPELGQKIHDKGRDEGRDEGRLLEARAMLRRVLARRGLTLGPDDEARIDACTDVAALERWLDEAAIATSMADVFRPASS